MFDKILRELQSPSAWVAGLVQYTVYRMVETRNIVGLGDFIAPGGGG